MHRENYLVLENKLLNEVDLSQNEYDSIFEIQRVILESLALENETQDILRQLCKLAEKLLPNSVASIMLLDKSSKLLSVLSAPSIPLSGHLALKGLSPGPGEGSCGNAVFRNEATFVINTFVDPKWENLREVAYDFNICSCWSMPVRNENNEAIGTFALSSFEHRKPSNFYQKLLEICSSIVNIVLKNENQKRMISKNEKRIRLFSRALQNSQEGIMITDINNNIVEINDSFTKILGYEKEEIIGKNPRVLSSSKQGKSFYKNMWDKIKKENFWNGEIINLNKNGEEITQWLAISSIFDDNGNLQNYLASFTDISKLKEFENKITYLAYHDTLTNLYNKAYLEKLLQKNEKSNFLLLLNIDNFSYVNLSYGFDIGDKLLIAVVNELRELCNEQELFRINADEFALYYQGKMRASEKIKKIRNHFNKTSFYIDDVNLNISFTYGASCGRSISFQNSTLALKRAQENGKNQYYIFSENDDNIDQNQREEFIKYNNILHNALKFNFLIPYFQGIMDNRTKTIQSYEALVRIVEYDNVISPYQFLQTAKLSGLLPEITKIMIDKSFEYMATNNFNFSINISEDDLNLNYLERYLLQKSDKYAIAPNRVTLEILEQISSSGKKDHLKQLNSLKRKGYRLAIDDFGAEYSNFERILDLEIDFLKIDARYIKNIDIDNKSYEIVKSIVYFAKNVDIPCIAEFVHNQSVQKIVEELDIEYSQGYYFSEPKDSI